jgi:predicted MFS family arabinose efflux permease
VRGSSTPDPAERPSAPAGSDSSERPIRNPLDPRNPLAGVYLAILLFELAEGALRFLVPIHLDAQGLGPAQVGLLVASFSFASLLSRGVVGGIYSASRAKWIIVFAGLGSTCAYLLIPFQTSLVVFTVLMALDGFGWGLATTSLLALMMVSTPRTMSPAVAMGWFVGFQSIALALATTTGGLLAQAFGVQAAMLILATIPVVGASLIALRLPPPVRELDDDAPDVETQSSGADVDVSTRPGRAERVRGTLVRGFRSVGGLPAAVWAAALVSVYVNVMNGLLQSFYPLLALGLGFSVAQVGTLSSLRSISSAASRFGAGWLFSRISPRRLHWPLLILSAGTVASLPSLVSYVATLPAVALNGVARGLLRVTTAADAMEAMQGRQAGLAAAAMTAGLDIGKLIGPLIGGFVAGAFGLAAMFQIVPLGFLAAYLVLHTLGRRRGRAAATTDAPHEGGTST